MIIEGLFEVGFTQNLIFLLLGRINFVFSVVVFLEFHYFWVVKN